MHGLTRLIIRELGVVEYTETWREMKAFTDSRTDDTADECWLLEHPPVYTLGQAGKHEHILNTTEIPVVESDRGGQVTYHGPGQLIAYTMIDLRRLGIGVRKLVEQLENTVITLLENYGVSSAGRRNAPGVYTGNAKIAALGLRVRKGCSYHGLALNVSTDLAPFRDINPCGYRGMQVTSTAALGITASMREVKNRMIECLANEFGYNVVIPDNPGTDNQSTAL